MIMIGLASDPVQQRRMAHSWNAQHPDDQEEEMRNGKDDLLSPSPFGTTSMTTTTTTTAVSKRQSDQDRLSVRTSTTDATTSKTIEANHATEETNKRTIRPLLQQKRKETNTRVPTSFTSKGSTRTNSSYLYLVSFIIFLIDNHSPAAA